MAKVNVVKRDGSLEAFSVDKIKKVIDFACKGLDVDKLKLESAFDHRIRDGIRTKDIQDNLIILANELCSVKESDWQYVAGRLLTMSLWAETKAYDVDFYTFFKKYIETGLYSHKALNVYEDSEIKVASSWVNKELDLQHGFASVSQAMEKYLLDGESIQYMFLCNALIIATVKDKDERLTFAKQVYDGLSSRKLSSATPWLSQLRSAGNINSCFVMVVPDDLDGIYNAVHSFARISKEGGGCGADFSRVRASGSYLKGRIGKAGSVIRWVKLFNDTAVAVNQGGNRAGAITCSLPIWHNDVEQFLDSHKEHGDLRSRCFDIQLQVTVHDYFVELAESGNEVWHTFCPFEVKTVLGVEIYSCFGDKFKEAYTKCVEAKNQGLLKITNEYNAKELAIKVLKSSLERGTPYIIFIDEYNRRNPNKHIGDIPCANLCIESTSVVIPNKYVHTCNLMSLVVGRIELDELDYYAGLCVEILDAGIELSTSPIEESYAHSRDLRTIGVGIQGLHDIIAREYKSYGDLDFITGVAERIQFACVRKSIELAKKHGAYPLFKGSEWDNGNMIKEFKKNSVLGLDWDGLQDDINKYGIRNSQMTSPAPNTTTSLFCEAAAGVMPVYSAFFKDSNSAGLFSVSGMYLKENPLCYAKDITKFYPADLTKSVGALQKFFDTGISAEYIMDKNREDFNAKYMWDLLLQAHKNKTKGIYYVRTIKKGEGIVKNSSACAGCED